VGLDQGCLRKLCSGWQNKLESLDQTQQQSVTWTAANSSSITENCLTLQFQVCCAQPLSTSQTFNGWSNATSKQIVFEFIDVCIMQIALANVVQ